VKLSLVLYALAIGLLTMGHAGVALLCAVWATVTIVVARSRRTTHTPQLAAAAAQEPAPMDWKLALSDVRTHVKDTGCLVRRTDFENTDGFCPNGGSYWEHD
jgi:hypothetical protein